nr:MAG TPA: replication initiator protein [Caudoviricetes sp.]
MSKNWDVCDQLNYNFIPVPKALAMGFKSVSINAKWTYSLLLDRMMASRKNAERFHDKNGMYLLFNQDEVAELIGASKRTVIRIFKELEESGLIETRKQGFGKAQKIYLRKLSELSEMRSETSSKKSCQNGTTRSDKMALREVTFCHHEKCQNVTTISAKLSPQEVTPVSPQDMPNLSPPTKSDTNMSDTNMSDTESSRSRLSNIAVNGSVGKTTPTQTQNCFVTSVVTPTLEKIQAFVKKNNFTFSAEKFYDYYNAIGWKIRGMPITDWQSLCRSWQARERPEAKPEIPHIKGYFEMTEEEREAARRRQAERNGNGRTSEETYSRVEGDLPF